MTPRSFSKQADASGYSGTPLAQKLGIRAGSRVRTQNAPDNYPDLLAPIPEGVILSNRIRDRIDIWHLFTRRKSGLEAALRRSLAALPGDGVIWVSWPKTSSGEVSDMSEDEVRRVALPLGLVDVKVCAVDTTWSGLKLVLRRELRR